MIEVLFDKIKTYKNMGAKEKRPVVQKLVFTAIFSFVLGIVFDLMIPFNAIINTVRAIISLPMSLAILVVIVYYYENFQEKKFGKTRSYKADAKEVIDVQTRRYVSMGAVLFVTVVLLTTYQTFLYTLSFAVTIATLVFAYWFAILSPSELLGQQYDNITTFSNDNVGKDEK